jgi:hypothetical protein
MNNNSNEKPILKIIHSSLERAPVNRDKRAGAIKTMNKRFSLRDKVYMLAGRYSELKFSCKVVSVYVNYVIRRKTKTKKSTEWRMVVLFIYLF